MELQKLFVTLALKVDEYKQGLRQAADQAEDMRGKVDKTLDKLAKKAKLAMAGVGLAILAGFGMAINSSIEVNAQLETTQLQFETLMGSADLAKEHVAGLFEFAEKTPFETGPIIDASLKLQTFGGEALNTMGNIQLLGDAAAATNAPIDELGFWVGRLYGNLQAGQPFGEAAMRLQELAVMSPQARTEMERLQKAGASAQEVFAYFQKDLGKFTGAMDKQASTWQGMVSTITDQIQLLVADALVPFFEEGKQGLTELIALLNDPDIVAGIQAMGTELGKVAEALADVLKDFIQFLSVTGKAGENKRIMEDLGLSWAEQGAIAERVRKEMGLGFFSPGSAEDLALQLAINDALKEEFGTRLEIMDQQKERAAAHREQQAAMGEFHDVQAEWLDIELAGWAAVVQAADPALRGIEAARNATTKYATDMGIWNENAGVAYHQAMEFGKALGFDAEQAAAAKLALEGFGEAFRANLGDYTKDLPGADKPLIKPESFVSTITGGLGPEQQALLDEYKTRVQGLTTEIFNLENGIGTYGLEQEKVNEKIADARGELAHYQGLMAPLASVTGEVSTTHVGLKVNVDAARQAIFDQLSQMPGAEQATIAYGLAIGVMSREQAWAALQAAIVQVKIEELAKAIAAGMPIDQAMADFDAFVAKIENEVMPATFGMAQEVPQNLKDMRTQISEEALASGRALGEGYQEGIDETRPEVIAASVKTAEDLIADTKGAFGIQSPSTVFKGIGGYLMDGLAVGIEAGKERLRGILAGVADLIPEWLRKFLGIASPAQSMVPIGEAIVDGIVAGIEKKGGDLIETIEALLDNAKRAADLTATFSGYFYEQMVAPIDEEIKTLKDGLKSIEIQRRGLNPVLEDVLLGLGIHPNDPGAEILLRQIQASSVKWSDRWTQAELGLNLLAERSRLTEEELALQDKLAAAEERRAEMQERMLELQEKQHQLNFLQAQFDLIKLIKDNELDPGLLQGIRLGTEASPTALMEIMGIVMEQLVEKASDELFAITATATPAENTTTPGLEDERSVTNINTQNIHGGQHNYYVAEPAESELERLSELLL